MRFGALLILIACTQKPRQEKATPASGPIARAWLVGATPAAKCGIKGSVVSAKGRPLQAVTVGLKGGSVDTIEMTDEKGRYEFPELPKGEYVVEMFYGAEHAAANVTLQARQLAHIDGTFDLCRMSGSGIEPECR